MSMQKTLLPLFSALALGTMIAPQANATLVYSAKFVCGAVPFESISVDQPVPSAPFLPPEVDAVVGVYMTSINIHNPQLTPNTRVQFTKKFVLAQAEGVTPRAPVTVSDSLGADLAEFVNCAIIYNHLFPTPPGGRPHIEGFVVLEVPENLVTGEFQFLDVVGKYTARSPDIGTYSPALEIVVYSPTIITD